MKLPLTLLLAPIIMLTTACSSHYTASSHSRGHHNGHVSVGIHSGHHGSSGSVLGALIIGGVIGHLLTEGANQKTEIKNQNKNDSSEDELVNGYSISDELISNQSSVQAERNNEQNRFYQLGKDENCYLMEKDENGELSCSLPMMRKITGFPLEE